jgi:hypothetical protein
VKLKRAINGSPLGVKIFGLFDDKTLASFDIEVFVALGVKRCAFAYVILVGSSPPLHREQIR